ncbi:4Fe-4S cluster-binding domain-containing protein [Spiroplasma cantharicola]|uniref:4Fe-4S cluster-binding domain-containing protein n=1 Tax=Spiroplasma cantharicola TaxID=362837 RepID=UPI0019103C14
MDLVIYIAGCLHVCCGCHNILSWNLKIGRNFDKEYETEIISEIKSNSLLRGVTFSGVIQCLAQLNYYPLFKK